VFRLRLLPWEYGVRNLLRRPSRSALTLTALATVVLLVLVVVGFIRGLETSLAASGDEDVVLVCSAGASEFLEASSVPASTASLLGASIEGISEHGGMKRVSPELFLGVNVAAGDKQSVGMGIVRGVATAAPLVRRQLRLVEGEWPKAGEVIVGRLAAAKLGLDDSDLAIGRSVTFERRTWRISGRFSCGGSMMEAEIWCPLADLQQTLKRQDVTTVALLLDPAKASPGDVQLFCRQRLDLEIESIAETEYFAGLNRHYRPVRLLAWTVVLLVSGAGVFAGLNMMHGAVAGRIREIAALQAIGYRRRAILLSLMQEGALLAACASLLAGIAGLAWVNGLAIRFTMGAFALRIDGAAVLISCLVGVSLGVLGAIPPAIGALRASVADGLKAI
jgi:ABC-type lipoprotein release transport system permease subunit